MTPVAGASDGLDGKSAKQIIAVELYVTHAELPSLSGAMRETLNKAWLRDFCSCGVVSELNQFQDQLSLLLASLTEQQRLQIQYYCDSDYRHELLRYNAETQKASNVGTRRSRNERFERYWRLMTERKLRRQRLVFYLSRKIETSSKGIKSAAALTEYYNQLLGQLRSEFEHTHEMLTEIFAGQSARIIPMKDADHFRHYKTFLNPTLAERFDYDPIDGFDPQLSIQENCWHREGAG